MKYIVYVLSGACKSALRADPLQHVYTLMIFFTRLFLFCVLSVSGLDNLLDIDNIIPRRKDSLL